MPNFSAVTLLGNLTKDAEFKTTANGTSILTFSVAINYKFKRADEWVEEVSYVDVEAFSSIADRNKGLPKGSMVFVTGRIKQHRWEDQGGNKRNKIIVNANNVLTFEKKEKAARDNGSPEF